MGVNMLFRIWVVIGFSDEVRVAHDGSLADPGSLHLRILTALDLGF
jgi:hypothetical protein